MSRLFVLFEIIFGKKMPRLCEAFRSLLLIDERVALIEYYDMLRKD